MVKMIIFNALVTLKNILLLSSNIIIDRKSLASITIDKQHLLSIKHQSGEPCVTAIQQHYPRVNRLIFTNRLYQSIMLLGQLMNIQGRQGQVYSSELLTQRIQFITYLSMYNKFDSYYYSRPVSYRSYNTRVSRPEILNISDPESTQVLQLLAKYKVNANNLGGLARGIQFGDLVVERRVFNHNSTAYYAGNDYVIRQWKETNDLSKEHPTGTHTVLKTFPELLVRLEKVIQEQSFKAQ